MPYEHTHHDVTDEDRREFLKVLGVTGTAVAGGVTLSEVRDELSAGAAEELAPIGDAIKTDLTGALDAGYLASHQATFSDAVSALPAAVEGGVPEAEPRDEFGTIAEAGWPIYDHLAEAGFFASTTEHLPTFTPESLTESAQAFVGSEALAEPLEELGISERVGVDLVIPTVNQAEQLSHFHWIASEGIPQDHEIREILPPITERAAGGVLLWLQNIDAHLYQNQLLITEEMLQNGAWDVQGMTAGFHLMTEGAKAIAEESGRFSNDELGALFTTSIALQEIAQRMLPADLFWITDEMRDPGNAEITEISL